MHVDLCFQFQFRRQSATVRSDDADGMRFVEEEQRMKPLFQLDQLAQRHPVAIHAKDRFGDHDDTRFGMFAARPFEVTLEFAEMVVRKNAHRRAAQARAIDQGCVAEFIEDDDILSGCQRGQSADRRGISAAETDAAGVRFQRAKADIERDVG